MTDSKQRALFKVRTLLPFGKRSMTKILYLLTLLVHCTSVSSFAGSRAKYSVNRHRIQATRTRTKITKLNAAASQQQLGEFKRLNIAHDEDGDHGRYVRLYDFSSSDPIEYRSMWYVQKQLVDSHLERLKAEFQKKEPDSQFLLPSCDFIPSDNYDYTKISEKDTSGKSRDAIILVQHRPVYTLGTGSDPKYVKLDEDRLAALGIDLIRVERGGEVTYHGPGQLTAYPILDLRGYNQDIHWYMRALEEAILVALENVGVTGATREDDVTGVWVNNRKVAAFGVKVRRWVTMHGLAVNVDSRSLGNFDGIVPCGLEGREVGCINDFLDEPITVEEFAVHLKQALQQVFEIELIA